MINLVRGELLKIRTTKAWWLFALGALGLLAVAFAYNALFAHFLFDADTPDGESARTVATFEAQRGSVYQAANLLTSGQFFGLLFVMLLGILLITNEFHHQTATSTFLTTPHRTSVISAKLGVAAIIGFLFWLVTTALNVPATMIFLGTEDMPTLFGESAVQRAILLNGLALSLIHI